ncbi:hypothetical protein ABVV53_06170 [Novosphingobium sp. RD2P27]|uniref:Lipoprotein n=1 Tax=Novosphingobium kalidii TaxID=3230299 RepID=A0ABV2CZM8_9SPHN
MQSRIVKLLIALATAGTLVLSGCKQEDEAVPPPEPVATESEPLPEVTPTGESTGEASGIAAGLDMGALQEREEPKRLLRFYADAIRLGDWQAAAKAWTLDSLMTPEKLRDEFGGDAGPKVAVGKGDASSAAGTLFFQAPVVVDFADGRPSRRGTIVLRRANDVPGASPEQLVWRIERNSIMTQ